MKKILIDMDDVLCYSVDRVVELYNKEFGTNYSIEDFQGWNLASYATNDIYKYYGMEGLHFFRDLKPIQEMIDLVHELISEGNEVVIVTSINKNNFEGIIDKTSWVETYLPDISDMLIVESKEYVEGDVLIDDGSHNLKASPATHKVLFDRPWNRDNQDYTRVDSAADIKEYLKTL